jgi:hypothetical protein
MAIHPTVVAPPIEAEIVATTNDTKIVAVGGASRGSTIYLRFAFHTGDTEIVWLDELGLVRLLNVLKALFPRYEAMGASRVVHDGSGLVAFEGETPTPR